MTVWGCLGHIRSPASNKAAGGPAGTTSSAFASKAERTTLKSSSPNRLKRRMGLRTPYFRELWRADFTGDIAKGSIQTYPSLQSYKKPSERTQARSRVQIGQAACLLAPINHKITS